MSNWETPLSLAPSAARVASGHGAAFDLGTRDRLVQQTLSVSLKSGTGPSLRVHIESSPDGLSGWTFLGTFAAATEKADTISVASPHRFVRAVWTIDGTTPSFTFAVVGTQGITFANLDDFDRFGIPSAALRTLSPTKKVEGLATATLTACGILGRGFTLPIVEWGRDITKNVCLIATYEMLSVHGFNPEGHDENVRTRYEDALKWFGMVADGKIIAVGLVDSTPDEADAGGAEVVTFPSRWRPTT